MTSAAMLLAVALVLSGDNSRVRIRAGRTSTPTRRRTNEAADPLAFASTLDVLAACLRSGMAVSAAATAVAPAAPRRLAEVLNRAADLLALGADPSTAWSDRSVAADRHVEALLRLARRSASSGTALAHGVADLAAQSRDDAADTARAAAERASVLIAGPLGVCYLPAFLCLGVVPVVAGLAGEVLQAGFL